MLQEIRWKTSPASKCEFWRVSIVSWFAQMIHSLSPKQKCLGGWSHLLVSGVSSPTSSTEIIMVNEPRHRGLPKAYTWWLIPILYSLVHPGFVGVRRGTGTVARGRWRSPLWAAPLRRPPKSAEARGWRVFNMMNHKKRERFHWNHWKIVKVGVM